MDKTVISKIGIATIMLLCQFSNQLLAQVQFRISGTVVSKHSGEPLPFAQIKAIGSPWGVTCNEIGRFQWILGEEKGLEIVFSHIGFKSDTLQLDIIQDTTLFVELEEQTEVLNEIILQSQKQNLIETKAGKVSITAKLVESTPTLIGEPDIIKTLQLLPGVSGGPEGSSGLYVRGGGPDQNLILLDNVPVYNISHLYGFISTFNGLAISNAQLIKGGFPAQYGGRLASILAVELREGNQYQWKKDLSISPLSANFLLEGPIEKEKSSIFISGRFSYFSWFLGIANALSKDNYTSNYNFGDWNARYTNQLDENNKISFSTYFGNDRFNEKQNQIIQGTNYENHDQLKWGNATMAMRWFNSQQSGLNNNLTAYFTQYKNDIAIQFHEIDSNGVFEVDQALSSSLKETGVKWHSSLPINKRHRFNFGSNWALQFINPGSKNFQFNNGNSDSTYLETELYIANNLSVYAEDHFQLSNRFQVSLGAHFNIFSQNKTQYPSLQPRVTAQYYLTEDLSIQGSYSRMQQTLHLLSNFGTGAPTNLWVSATDAVKPSQAEQYAFQLSYYLRKWKLKFDFEAYHKQMTDLITFEDGFNFLKLGNWEENIVKNGQGEAYGMEFLLSKSFGRLTGFVGYTYSKTNRKFSTINEGQWYPYQFDRRHDISIVGSIRLKENMRLNFNWVFSTGNAITLENSVFAYGGSGNAHINILGQGTVHNPGPRNWFRMESSHRLDLGLQITKKRKNSVRILSIGLYNAYARNNPYYYRFSKRDDGTIGLFKVAVLPIIPSVSWRIKF